MSVYSGHCFLYNNLVTSTDDMTASSQATGIVASFVKTRSTGGSAVMYAAGDFSGSVNRTITVVIDSIAAGNDIGNATFKYRYDTTGAGSWEATGQATATTGTSVGAGVSVYFNSVGNTDFAVGDAWVIECNAVFSTGHLIDFSKETRWRTTGDTSENIVIDLGSAQNVTDFILSGHNLTDSATVSLQAHTSNSWGAPSHTTSCTIQDPIIEYLDQTYRYWRPLIADATNPDTYIEAELMFLGTYFEPEFPTIWGSAYPHGLVMQTQRTVAGDVTQYVRSNQRTFSLSWPENNSMSNTEIANFKTMRDALIDLDTGAVDPVWFHFADEEDDSLALCRWMDIDNFNRTLLSYLQNGFSMNLREVPARGV